MSPTVFIHDAHLQQWLTFKDPVEVMVVRRVEEVLPAMQAVEHSVDRHGYWAAGFMSYEAAPAFDSALYAYPADEFPLLWFGLFRSPQVSPSLPPSSAFRLGEWSPSVTRQEYDQAITRIKEQIARGNTYQVNYTMRLQASFQGDPLGLFQSLVRVQPTAYAAHVDIDDFAICSASPELFFQLDGEKIVTRPMKGTISRGLTLDEDNRKASNLKSSEKDRAENAMIVDMLRNDLGRIAETGSVNVPRLFEVERYPTVWQMTSTVTATSRASITEIMSALFPCASITGAPKSSTTRIIKDLEAAPRHVYTGCIGFIAPERQAQFNVAIRTVLIGRKTGLAEYGVGGGIVWDSTPQGEYEECQIKARLLTDGRPDFSLLESLLWSPEEGYYLLDYHFRRLVASAEYFEYPCNLEYLRVELDKLAAGLPPSAHKVRLLLAQTGKVTLDATPLAHIPKPETARVMVAPTPVNAGDVFLYHKTTHRQVYQAAEFANLDCDEILLWNERGEVTETTTANIVVELDGELLTPPVSSGLLAGTYRAWLLEQGLTHERVILTKDLQRCKHIYLVNSIRKQRTAILVE